MSQVSDGVALATPPMAGWPPDDTEESVLGTNLHQATITNVRWGLNEVASLFMPTDQAPPGRHSARPPSAACSVGTAPAIPCSRTCSSTVNRSMNAGPRLTLSSMVPHCWSLRCSVRRPFAATLTFGAVKDSAMPRRAYVSICSSTQLGSTSRNECAVRILGSMATCVGRPTGGGAGIARKSLWR